MEEANKILYKPIAKLFKSHGIDAYVCGNTARDLYRNTSPIVNEIAVNTTIQFLRDTFKNKIIDVSEYDTTVTMEYMDKIYIIYPLKKITMVNTYYGFEYTDDVSEDAAYRDFTCNSLYYDPLEHKWFDFNNGMTDIDNKIIRMVGDPKTRILESRVRSLRAAVLCAILGEGWTIEPFTQNVIKEYRLKIVPLHPKQIYEEMTSLFLNSEKPSKAFKLMKSMKLLEGFFPELNETIEIEQTNKAENLDLFTHIMLALDSVPMGKPNTLKLRIAVLLHDIGKPYTQIITDTGNHFYNHENIGAILAERILQRWGFSKYFIDTILILIKNHLFDASLTKQNSIKKLVGKVGNSIHDLVELRIADRIGTGRRDISMAKIYLFRDKINEYLAGSSLDSVKLQVSEVTIRRMLSKYTDNIEEAFPEVTKYLRFKIVYGKISNTVPALKRVFHRVAKIKCPLDKPHLFKTWTEMETDNADRFQNGNLTCGVYCNFLCNKVLKNNHK